VSFPRGRGIVEEAFAAVGFPVAGPRAVRADVLARVHLRSAEVDAPTLASWLGCPTHDVSRVLAALAPPAERQATGDVETP
jgi:hypothetical protein